VVEGFVAEKESGLPLARSRVGIRSIQQGLSVPSNRVLTDSSGHFRFSRLPAGAYFLTAEKSGYARAEYGQKKWNGSGTPIVLDEASRFSTQFRLSKLGVVTGKVTDENGVGLQQFQVIVYRDTTPLELAAHGVTDDRGVYRVAGLEPGRYHVRTGPRTLEDGAGLLPTFLGGTASAEESRPIEVRLDDETGGIDITPAAGKLFKLSGQVAWPGVSSVSLYSDLGEMRSGVDSAGKFTFAELAPGSYELIAESMPQPPLAAYRKLWLSGDIEGLVLSRASAPSVSINCKERDGEILDPRQVSSFLSRSAPPADSGPRRILCGEKVTLGPGKWQMAVATPSQYYIDSVTSIQKSATSNEFTLMPGQTVEITVVLSSKPASLRGHVIASGGQPAIGASVFLNALTPEVRNHLYGPKVAKAGPKGEYNFEGLPPGSYQVLSSFEFQKPEEVDWSTSPWKPVNLEEGKEATLDLELAGGP
jgi:hypothetical protein